MAANESDSENQANLERIMEIINESSEGEFSGFESEDIPDDSDSENPTVDENLSEDDKTRDKSTD